MALTLADRHKRIYVCNRKNGLTHEQALERVPLEMREQFLKDITSTHLESHYGIINGKEVLIKALFFAIGITFGSFLVFYFLK